MSWTRSFCIDIYCSYLINNLQTSINFSKHGIGSIEMRSPTNRWICSQCLWRDIARQFEISFSLATPMAQVCKQYPCTCLYHARKMLWANRPALCVSYVPRFDLALWTITTHWFSIAQDHTFDLGLWRTDCHLTLFGLYLLSNRAAEGAPFSWIKLGLNSAGIV